MISKNLTLTLTAIALVTSIGMATVGTALAQTGTPPAQSTPDSTTTQPRPDSYGLGRGFGFRGGDSSSFDLVAEKLGLSPTELFEALHSGKTLSEISNEKGIDLAAIETALNTNRVAEMKAKLAQAVQDGTMTQEEADWWTTGIDKGWVSGARGGLGLKALGGRHGTFERGSSPRTAPTSPSTGATS